MSDAKNKSTGDRLQVVQNALGLNTSEMAAVMGYTDRTQYLKVRRGEIAITPDRLIPLHENYNVNLNYLLTGNCEHGIILKSNSDDINPEEYNDKSLANYMEYMRNWFEDCEPQTSLKRIGKIILYIAKIIGEIE